MDLPHRTLNAIYQMIPTGVTLLIIMLLLGYIVPAQATEITSIRGSTSKERIRIVFDVTEAPSYEAKSGTSSEVSKPTEKITLTLPHTTFTETKLPSLKDSLLDHIQVATSEAGTTLDISLNYPAPHRIFTLTNPHRLVVDIEKLFSQETSKTLAGEVLHKTIYQGTEKGPVKIHLITVDPKKVWIEPRIALSASHQKAFSLNTVSTFAQEPTAIFASNGGYYDANGKPLGGLMINQTLISTPLYHRAALLVFKDQTLKMTNLSISMVATLPDGTDYPIPLFNTPRKADQVVLYNTAYGTHTKTNPHGLEFVIQENKVANISTGDTPIPQGGFVLSAHGAAKKYLAEKLKAGDSFPIRFTFDPPIPPAELSHLIAGGPFLVQQGEIFMTATKERFRKDITKGYAARTAVGLTQEGKLLIATVDGLPRPHYFAKFFGKETPYRMGSIGMTLKELASFMKAQGAYIAMNLDGGSSTTLAIRGKLVNAPTTVMEKPVSNALVFYESAPTPWRAEWARALPREKTTPPPLTETTREPTSQAPPEWRDDLSLWSEE